MIKHVVMWKFKPDTHEQMMEFVEKLRGLYGVIPQIREQEVGVDCLGDGNYHAVLISLFDSVEDLNTYKNDPRHVAVAGLCKDIREDRVAVDFTV